MFEHDAGLGDEVLAFIIERLRVQLRSEGRRHDVLAAAFAAAHDDDLTRLLRRAEAVEALLGTPEGADLLAAYRRATNILRIEGAKGAPVLAAPVEESLLTEDAEKSLHAATTQVFRHMTGLWPMKIHRGHEPIGEPPRAD